MHVTQGHLPAQCKCASICKQVRSPPGPEQWEPDQERKLQLIFHRCLAVHTMHTGTDKYTMTFDTEDTFMLQLSNRGVGFVLWRELDRTTPQKDSQIPCDCFVIVVTGHIKRNRSRERISLESSTLLQRGHFTLPHLTGLTSSSASSSSPMPSSIIRLLWAGVRPFREYTGLV